MRALENGSVEFADINHNDAPDYCDAFISNANWADGEPLTDEELDELNEDRSFVYELLMENLH